MLTLACALLGELTRERIVEELGLGGFDLTNRLHVLVLLLGIGLLIAIYAAIWGKGHFGSDTFADCGDPGDFGGD